MLEETFILFIAIFYGLLFVQILFLSQILSTLRQLLELVKPAPQLGVVKGNVTYGDASLIEGVLITMSDQAGVTIASVLTGPAGEFELDPLAIGTYELYAHKDLPDGWLEAEVTVEVNAPEVIITDLPLVRVMKCGIKKWKQTFSGKFPDKNKKRAD
jgi:hypothetical protein